MFPKVTNVVFALLIFLAHLNCVVEHQLFGNFVPVIAPPSLDREHDAPSDRMPADSEECDHECICKGATLAQHFVFADFDDQRCHVHVFELALLGMAFARSPVDSDLRMKIHFCCLPLRN